MNKDNILEVKGLHKRFTSKGVTVKAVTDVSFNVKPGETIGIVGESGWAKLRWDAVSSGLTTPLRARSSTALRPAKKWIF